MSKQGNKPELRFKEFNDYWGRYRMEQLADCYDGTHQTPKYVKSGVPFVSVENIKNYASKSKFITKEAFDKNFKNKPKKGDVIMTRITAGIIGMTSIVENDDDLAYYVSVALIRKKKNISSSFLAHRIESEGFKRELHRRIIHVAFPKKINLGDLQKCVTFTPSLLEQQKIADFLSTVDQKIQALTRKKGLLEEYKKGVMQQLFKQEIRFKQEDGRDYPDWEEKRLGDVCETIKSGKSKSSDDGAVPLYGSTGVIGKCIQPAYQGEFILIARVGANAGKINLIDGDFGVSDNTLVVSCMSNLVIKYIYYFLDYFNLNRLVFGSGQPLITGGQLKSLKLNLPNKEEQQKIATCLSSIDTKIESVDHQIIQTQTWKKGLLQKMFV